MKKIFGLSAIALFALFSVSQATAAGDCKVVYGGGEVCPPQAPHEVNKQIRLPDNGEYVEDMTINSPRKYRAGELATFKIILKNTTAAAISIIDVTDTLPTIVEFFAGPGVVGRNGQNRQIVTFTVRDLKAGQSVEFFITTRALDANDCQKNEVKAVVDKKEKFDSAQICIEKAQQVLGVGKGGLVTTPTPAVMPTSKAGITPPTGPEALGLLALIPSGIAGFFIRKRKLL